ncbi:phage portal protein [Micromonospora sp. CPCC 206171]|uniref:phage portal protein n=1 Tax=Micromonospora sp. CPCC 206171 TaxID=3122405 RepID=UPI002FEE88C2
MTEDNALGLVPYFSCVRLLADQVSALPLHAYRETSDGQKLRAANVPVLTQPAAVVPRVQWVRQLVASLAIRGNAYGLVTARDEQGYPLAVEWLNPDEVFCDESKPTLPQYYWQGQPVPRENIVHIPWFVLPGKVRGLSPIATFANTIGVGLAATQYGASWFENGGTPPGVFKNKEKTFTPQQAQDVSESLSVAIRGRKPIVHGSDWDYTALKVSPEESQFIQTKKMNATEIAAIFGIPPEMVGGEAGGTLTYNTVEGNGINLLKIALNPILVLIESYLSELLPDGMVAQFNVDAVVRADIKTRYESHQIGINAGFLTPNEARALEDLPPLPGGDELRPLTNTTPQSSPEPDDKTDQEQTDD